MGFDPDKHHRRSIRLAGYDYAQAGAYFVTVCAHGRQCLFGDVADGEMRLNAVGRFVADCLCAIPTHFRSVLIDSSEWIVIPNHVHMIVVIVGATHASPLHRISRDPSAPQARGPSRKSLATIVGSFKSAVTKRINQLRGMPGAPVWQRNYYEHIIRNDTEWHRIAGYIATNPAGWDDDVENPNRRPAKT